MIAVQLDSLCFLAVSKRLYDGRLGRWETVLTVQLRPCIPVGCHSFTFIHFDVIQVARRDSSVAMALAAVALLQRATLGRPIKRQSLAIDSQTDLHWH